MAKEEENGLETEIDSDISTPNGEEEEQEFDDSHNIDELFEEEDREFRESIGIKPKQNSFFVNIFNAIENFSLKRFKANTEQKKEGKRDERDKRETLKKSSTTIEDVQKQRKNSIKYVGMKLGIIGLVIIFITVAIILSFQDNEQALRPNINMKAVLNDTTSFGGIDQKDYFLEQNILDEKIDKVAEVAKNGRDELKDTILNETATITKHINLKIEELSEEQAKKGTLSQKELMQKIDTKINEVAEKTKKENIKTLAKIKKLNRKVGKYKNSQGINLKNGKIVFPSRIPNSQNVINPVPALNNKSNTDSTDSAGSGDLKSSNEPEQSYEEAELDMSNTVIPELKFDTGLEEPKSEEQDKGFEFDLTTTLVRVTLINGIKAPTLDIGVKNPTPVLMSVDGVAYAANDNKDVILKGCLLRGIAVGNINTSRAEIFGTHLSCIIEGDSGEKYKVEHTFPNNEVWIKGEDGADGVSGLIVDSSGKILSKSAAIGFMQGLTNYFSAQNLVTGGLASTTGGANQANFTQQLGTSMQSGVGSGLSSGFDLIIQKYEEILGGYYPFIDVKGGRKNLTAIFAGGTKLKATPYNEAHLENH